jgi:hypothetical protein
MAAGIWRFHLKQAIRDPSLLTSLLTSPKTAKANLHQISGVQMNSIFYITLITGKTTGCSYVIKT